MGHVLLIDVQCPEILINEKIHLVIVLLAKRIIIYFEFFIYAASAFEPKTPLQTAYYYYLFHEYIIALSIPVIIVVIHLLITLVWLYKTASSAHYIKKFPAVGSLDVNH